MLDACETRWLQMLQKILKMRSLTKTLEKEQFWIPVSMWFQLLKTQLFNTLKSSQLILQP